MTQHDHAELFRTLFENSADCIALSDSDGIVRYISPSVETILGYKPEEMQNRHPAEFIHPDDLEQKGHLFSELLKQPGGTVKIEWRKKHRNGEWTWVEGISRNLLENPAVRAIVTHCRDISEHVRAKALLAKTKEELERNSRGLREAQAIAKVGSWEGDHLTRETRWSEETFKIFGLQKDEIVPSLEAYMSFVHPDDIRRVNNIVAITKRMHSDCSFQCRITRKDGEERFIYTDCRYELDIDGEPLRLFGIIQDITESKRAEQNLLAAKMKLEHNEKRLQDAQQMAHVGDWEADFITGVDTWSDESYRILGMMPGELPPSLELFLSFVHPEDIGDVKKRMQEGSETLRGFSSDCRIIRKDGAVRFLHSDCRFIMNEAGQPVRLHGFMQDVTETRLLEQSLVETNKDLETFIYKASHDLRGPLVSIIGLTDACREEIGNGSGKPYMEMIGQAIRKLDYTLTSLVQSMSIKKTQLLNDAIDFNELIPEVLSQLQHYEGFSTMNISINVKITQLFSSSRFILQSILQNLFENAVKYRDVNALRPELNISVEEHNNEVIICCQDNGMGIDRKLHEKVFEMYFRGTEMASGSGLGLYLVKNGIDRLGGRITVESERGVGSKFFVHLPLVARPCEYLQIA